MKYILIYYVLTTYSGVGSMSVATGSPEFDSTQSCDVAKKALIATAPTNNIWSNTSITIKAECYKK